MKKLFSVALCLLFANFSNADVLNWETNKAAAFAKALQENKLVLMVRGNSSCVYCQNAKGVICESTDPDVAGLIQEHYVPWFAIAANTTEGKEYYDKIPIGPNQYTIIDYYPIIACIDPHFTNKCYDISVSDRKIGVELTTTSFYARLSSHIIPKSKEKVKFTIFWEKANKDKLLFKLQFMANEKPFNENSEVTVQLGTAEDDIISKKKANVKGDRLKISNNYSKLKLSWNKKTKICSLVFKSKKSTLSAFLDYMSNEAYRIGSRATQLRIKIDETVYYFYPRTDYKLGGYKTIGKFQRKK